MIIYNVSIKIDTAFHDEWLDWMQYVHLPAVMSTGCFLDHKMYKLMIDDEDGQSYVIQYQCMDIETLIQYQNEFGPGLRAETDRLFKDRYVAFRTVMEQV